MIVAIDGPAGAGKSTIARRVAERPAPSISTRAPCTGPWRSGALRVYPDLPGAAELEALALASDIRFEAEHPRAP